MFVDPLTPSSTVRAVNEAAELLWVGGWEIAGRVEKDRVRRRDNISEEVSGLFIVSGSTLELVDKGHVSGVSISLIKERDRERGDIAVTVSDRSCSV